MSRLLPIVEGHGDLQAVPLLVRRILWELHGRHDVEVLAPQRRGEWTKVKQQFERFFITARLEEAPILWVLDFDCESCVDHHAERSWALAEAARLDASGPIEVVFMVKEYESLFLWQSGALADGFGEAIAETSIPSAPEDIRDAKGFVSGLLPKGRSYKPTVDQARITQRLDLALLQQRSPSFQRLDQAIRTLCNTANDPESKGESPYA